MIKKLKINEEMDFSFWYKEEVMSKKKVIDVRTPGTLQIGPLLLKFTTQINEGEKNYSFLNTTCL
jgi:hypothetical protein